MSQYQPHSGGHQEQPWRLRLHRMVLVWVHHFEHFVCVGLGFAIVLELVLTRPSREYQSCYVIIFSIIYGCVIRCFAQNLSISIFLVILRGNLGDLVLHRMVLILVHTYSFYQNYC